MNRALIDKPCHSPKDCYPFQGKPPQGKEDTVNVDIFACIHFCVFPKIGNFAEIYIRVFNILASMLHYKSYFHDIHIFADI